MIHFDFFPDVCAPHTLLISSQSSYGASSLYPQPHSDAVQNSRSYVRLECRWNDQHADVTPISVSRSSIWPADFYDAEKCTMDEKFIQQKMKLCDKRTQTIFYNTNICIWQWYWIITLKNITRVSFRKKKEVCEGCEETTAVLLPSHIKANICLQFCAIRNVLKYARCFFWFHQRCLWGPILFVTAEQTQRQTLQMLTHSLVLRACSVCALTQTHSPRIHTAKNGQACIQIMWLSEQAVGWEGMSFNGLKWKELQAWEVFRFPAHSFQRRKRFIQKHHVSHSFYFAFFLSDVNIL